MSGATISSPQIHISKQLLSPDHQQFFEENGYLVVAGVFSASEVEILREHFMDLRQAGTYPGDMVADVPCHGDPLQQFPRMIHMHHWDEISRRWLLDSRLNACLSGLLGREPYAVQSMIYFKPPGARGQALHQDNFYLQVTPGTCMAAWLALDPCDEENGCMRVVPGSHRWPILCPVESDAATSFTNITVPLPPDASSVPVLMDAGDVLFFNGSLVHGSFPNTSKDRFRRTLIGHYVEGGTQELTPFDRPVLLMNGQEMFVGASQGGAPCGEWIERDGAVKIEMRGALQAPHTSE